MRAINQAIEDAALFKSLMQEIIDPREVTPTDAPAVPAMTSTSINAPVSHHAPSSRAERRRREREQRAALKRELRAQRRKLASAL